MAESRPVLGQLLDALVFAPIGVAVRAATDVPRLVDERRTAIHQRLQVARWVGEMTVHYGRQQLQEARRRPQEPADGATPVEPAPTLASIEPPFEGYDTLAASEIVQLLGRLPHVELSMVREYEAAHRGRRTVLAKVDQLLAE